MTRHGARGSQSQSVKVKGPGALGSALKNQTNIPKVSRKHRRHQHQDPLALAPRNLNADVNDPHLADFLSREDALGMGVTEGGGGKGKKGGGKGMNTVVTTAAVDGGGGKRGHRQTKSILERNPLDEFLANSLAAQTQFEAERGHVSIVDGGGCELIEKITKGKRRRRRRNWIFGGREGEEGEEEDPEEEGREYMDKENDDEEVDEEEEGREDLLKIEIPIPRRPIDYAKGTVKILIRRKKEKDEKKEEEENEKEMKELEDSEEDFEDSSIDEEDDDDDYEDIDDDEDEDDDEDDDDDDEDEDDEDDDDKDDESESEEEEEEEVIEEECDIRWVTAHELENLEKDSFLEWRRKIAMMEESEEEWILTPYERNIEFWKQLWRVVEKSQLLLLILDARNPLLFRSPDLEKYVKEVDPRKEILLVMNKADFLPRSIRRMWAEYFGKKGIEVIFFSALWELHRQGSVVFVPSSSSSSSSFYSSVFEKREEEGGSSSMMYGRMEDKSEEFCGDGSDVVDCDALLFFLAAKKEKLLPLYSYQISPTKNNSPSKKLFDVTPLVDGRKEEEGKGLNSNNSRDIKKGGRGGGVGKGKKGENFVSFSCDEGNSIFPISAPFSFQPGAGNASEGEFVVGLVGYPNVGKSSIINCLFGAKKTSVSRQPGKTKHFQTLQIPSIGVTLCDCPGLVFPSVVSTRFHLLINSIVPIDNFCGNLQPAIQLICNRLPAELCEIYGVSTSLLKRTKKMNQSSFFSSSSHSLNAQDFLIAFANVRKFVKGGRGAGPDTFRVAKIMLKEFCDGKLLYWEPPPFYVGSSQQPSFLSSSSTMASLSSTLSRLKLDEKKKKNKEEKEEKKDESKCKNECKVEEMMTLDSQNRNGGEGGNGKKTLEVDEEGNVKKDGVLKTCGAGGGGGIWKEKKDEDDDSTDSDDSDDSSDSDADLGQDEALMDIVLDLTEPKPIKMTKRKARFLQKRTLLGKSSGFSTEGGKFKKTKSKKKFFL